MLLLVFVAGCSGSSGDDATATPSPSATATSAAGSPTATTTSTGTPAATSESSTEPTIDRASIGIEVRGDQAFIDQTEAALALLATEAPEFLATVDEHVETIRSVEAGSGMDVFTKTYLVGDETAFAPGYPPAGQVVWLAGTIVHDACHSEQFTAGREIRGQMAEVECLITQRAALELFETGTTFRTYVTGLIDGADDPANQYWNNPNRHW